MTETISIGRGKGKSTRTETRIESFDLTALHSGYSREFVLALKQMLIERRMQVTLATIKTEFDVLRSVFKTCQDAAHNIVHHNVRAPSAFARVDRDFLSVLWAVCGRVSTSQRRILRALFDRERTNEAIFAPGLARVDFPDPRADPPEHANNEAPNASDGSDAKHRGDAASFVGNVGRLRQRVLATALTRALMVQYLNITEEAFEAGRLSMDVYAYSRLLMCRAARPESTRLIRCKDLIVDTKDGKTVHFLRISLPKGRTAVRTEPTIQLPDEVGALLESQRVAVIKRLSNLVQEVNEKKKGTAGFMPLGVGDLPLFPSGGAAGRMGDAAKARLGFMLNSAVVTQTYVNPLKRLTKMKLNHNVMRHTMGTQLALAGCSASTIAAVLMHATDDTARVYVDLFFEGAIDALSDSMEPAFQEHFPVIKSFMSVNDPIDPARRISSEDIEDARVEMTGGCGRRVACSYAPITCYECPRFIPAYDADHTINLRIVERETAQAETGGLARQREVRQYKHIANRIRVVIMLCEIKRTSVQAQTSERT